MGNAEGGPSACNIFFESRWPSYGALLGGRPTGQCLLFYVVDGGVSTTVPPRAGPTGQCLLFYVMDGGVSATVPPRAGPTGQCLLFYVVDGGVSATVPPRAGPTGQCLLFNAFWMDLVRRCHQCPTGPGRCIIFFMHFGWIWYDGAIGARRAGADA